ncbi:MAG: TlpA disulfide reductase family protein [Bacteroidales bacterium]|nr:TlpA disulfide reductase family protein [Bacteroidales bacterium]
MQLIRTLVFLISVLACQDVSSQHVVLMGKAPQFAGEYLVIRKISNPVTGHATILDTLHVGADGTFNHQLACQQPQWFFINTGIFRITMFITPGKGYEITLPPKTEKTENNIRNPFFKPMVAHIQVAREFTTGAPETSISGNDINSRIFRFDTLISSTNRQMMEARRLHRSFNSDSVILAIEQSYQHNTSSYFQQYRRFRYGILKINSRDVGLAYLMENFLSTEIPLTENPAYMELFGEMYAEFLFYFSRTDEGKSIGTIINRKQDLAALKDTMMKHPAVPDRKIAELIVLKEIFGIYSKDYFYGEALLMLLDTVIRNPELPEYAAYARDIKEYLTRLKIGERPPEISLVDQDDNLRSFGDFRGKYVYLNFCTPDNYSCLKEFPFMKAIYEVHSDYLEVVTIMVTEEPATMKDFMERNDYNWTSLFYGNDEELLQNYNVRAFPAGFLLDREGILVQSPAALATEGLEMQLFRIMRSRGDL